MPFARLTHLSSSRSQRPSRPARTASHRPSRRLPVVVVALAGALAATLPAVPGTAADGETTFVLSPLADSTVGLPELSGAGQAPSLGADADPSEQAYLRFEVPALPGAVRQVALRAWVLNGTIDAPVARATSPAWAEGTLTWANRPVAGATLGDLGEAAAGTWAEWDVTPLVTGPGQVAVVLVPESTDGIDVASREDGARAPQLIVRAVLPAQRTVVAEADARVEADSQGTSYGSSSTLSADDDPQVRSYLRFRVEGLSGPVDTAVLRLWVTDYSGGPPAVHRSADGWDEGTLTWSNQPGAGGLVVEADGPGAAGSWLEYDVSGEVDAAGTWSFVLVSSSRDALKVASRESGERAPQLVVSAAAGDPPPTTRPPTTQPPGGTSCSSGWDDASKLGQLPSGTGEVSGFTTSRRHPGWGWAIRDSGHPASLYAVRLGSGGSPTVREFPVVGGVNRDWEDVIRTEDTQGRSVLWILENVGNGHGGNRILYRVMEPDPGTPAPVVPTNIYQIRYPDSQSNTEALLAFGNEVVVVAKSSPARVYRFEEPLSPLRVNESTYVGLLSQASNPSMASLSPDRRYLAVASHSTLRIYRNRGDLFSVEDLIADPPVHVESMPDDNREAGSFLEGSCDYVMIAESKGIWLVHNG